MTIIIVVVGIIIDRLTKFYAISQLAPGNDVVLVKDLFKFSYLENSGAAFGIFKDKSIFLIIFTLIIVLGIIFYIFKYSKKSPMILNISLAFIVSGAIGNLIDRIQYKYVIDFILIHYKDRYYFPTFNVADILVSLGTFLLIIYAIKEEKNEK